MSRQSISLLPSNLVTEDVHTDIVGDPVRADLWRGQSDHVYTVAVYASAYNGTVVVEASLAAEPGEGDWFPIVGPYSFADPYTGLAMSGARGESFKGIFTWLRARASFAGVRYPTGIVDRVLLSQ